MKRMFFIVLLLLMVSTTVSASSINGDYDGSPVVRVIAEGDVLRVEDVPAVVYKGRTMIPLYMLRQLGYNVSWNGETYTVELKNVKQEQSEKKLTAADIASMNDRTGTVYAEDSSGKKIGSAIMLTDDGIMVTNYHVAGKTDSLSVMVAGKTYTAKILHKNEDKDLVYFQITGNFKAIEYSRTQPKVGDTVYAIGSPRGLDGTVTEGKVTALRNINGKEYVYIQHTAKLEGGNSGGPLLNDKGELIGINSNALTDTSLNFALHAYYLDDVTEMK